VVHGEARAGGAVGGRELTPPSRRDNEHPVDQGTPGVGSTPEGNHAGSDPSGGDLADNETLFDLLVDGLVELRYRILEAAS